MNENQKQLLMKQLDNSFNLKGDKNLSRKEKILAIFGTLLNAYKEEISEKIKVKFLASLLEIIHHELKIEFIFIQKTKKFDDLDKQMYKSIDTLLDYIGTARLLKDTELICWNEFKEIVENIENVYKELI